MSNPSTSDRLNDIAIIGMSGRFPGARNIEELWQNLRDGIESISFFSDEELRAVGVEDEELNRENYVKAGGVLEDIEMFDAGFFGFNAREAEILDPQHRVFLEVAWEGLERAGYDPETYSGLIGVYAGGSMNNYIEYIYSNPQLMKSMGGYKIRIANDKDHLPTRVSYKLNLKGPSVAVQTACSTSLVAVHMACQSLLNHECDMAMAGGVSISLPQKGGYFYQDGAILSPDGHCRAFDAKARGTVTGNGAGVVVLKRLADAVADRDRILAVIKGSAINNDGSLKVGYTAPSIEGQAEVIMMAQDIAEVEPETISYIEAHGTGTQLGDPIEIAALTKVFRASTQRKGFCAIGSVKSNLGHLDAAAGVTGLIKTVLSLTNKQIPASLHYEEGNPEIDFANSPFYVNSGLREWERGESKRRAGVSSFGIGGTNAHVIVEEWEEQEQDDERRVEEGKRRWELVVMSARSEEGLEEVTKRIGARIREEGDGAIGDIAYTLQVGRRGFSHRRMLVCSDAADAVAALKSMDPKRVITSSLEPENRPVIFMFPGQGSQYVNMGLELYQSEDKFREQVDRCSELLQPHLGFDLRNALYPAAEKEEGAAKRLEQTSISQPALFVIEYSLAKLWMEWGVRPQAMIGHSIGEYVAACLAEVFSLEQALELVAVRGQLMQRMPPGAMLAVALSDKEAAPLLGRQLSLSAINGPARCVISGPEEAIYKLQEKLAGQKVPCRRLSASHAFHSWMMEPAIDPFVKQVRKLKPKPPKIAYVSNVTGSWITAQDVADETYWGKHLRKTVRFADGLGRLMKESGRILLEVGPGHSLSSIARQQVINNSHAVFSSMREAGERQSVEAVLLNALGQVWLSGKDVDWFEFHSDEGRRRVALPTYPFERKRFWAELPIKQATPAQNNGSEKRPVDSAHAPMEYEPASIMKEQAHEVAYEQPIFKVTAGSRRDEILSRLKIIIERLAGVPPSDVDVHMTFLEMGVDSLLLIQANQAIEEEFGIKLSLVQLLEDLTTIDALVDYLDSQLPHEAPLSSPSFSGPAPAFQSQQVNLQPPDAGSAAAIIYEPASDKEKVLVSKSAIEHIQSQIQFLSQQVSALLNGKSPEQRLNPAEIAIRSNGHEKSQRAGASHNAEMQSVASHSNAEMRQSAAADLAIAPLPVAPPKAKTGEAFIPYQPITIGQVGGLSTRQQEHLESLIARYTRRTQRSKMLTQEHRSWFADNRASADFRLQWKEMIYPIVGERSLGSRMWDVDGNEYVDLTIGFGVSMFGHSPDFITKAIEEQLKQGIQLGPQSDSAGKVAKLICELTGVERAAFCNSGTEAVMAALRLARTIKRRNKIALFAGSYHGSFDGTLVRGLTADAQLKSLPMAPGVPPGMVSDVLVLNYDDPQSLEIIKAHAHELAGVLVEPVQSRRPEVQPKAFLQQLRLLTEQIGTPLIFDEVITGFRIHPGGAQAWFDVQADLTVYGKVIGGGLPIGVVAGKAAYMDAIDGGMWSFGDGSYPRGEKTYFAGTFCKHPLAMAAALAVLNHMKERGPRLQEELNERAADLVKRLNDYFKQDGVPAQVVNFGALFRFVFSPEVKYLDLFFYHLIENGVYVWEGRNCFLSTAHTDEDIDAVIEAVKRSVAQLRDGEFLPASPFANLDSGRTISERPDVAMKGEAERSPVSFDQSKTVNTNQAGEVATGDAARRFPLTEAQRQLWVLTQMGDDSSRAYNESITMRIRGRLNLGALRDAFQAVVDRHEALRTVFSKDGDYQLIHEKMRLDIPLVDFSTPQNASPEVSLSEWLAHEAQQPFDISRGPLLRAHIIKLEEEYHLVVFTIHHIITDAWSTGIVLGEVSALYSAQCQGVTCQLPEPIQFSEYVQLQSSKQEAGAVADEAYWLEQFAHSAPVLELPTDRARPSVQTYAGNEQSLKFDATLSAQLARLSAQQGCTLFMTLLAAYKVLLSRLTGQDDIVVAVPAAGQTSTGNNYLVGYCINLLPIRSSVKGDLLLTDFLKSVKRRLLEGYDHQNYPYSQLIKKLNLRWDPSRTPLVSTLFNFDRASSGQEFSDLEVEVVRNVSGSTKFEFDLSLVERDGELLLECAYNKDLFEDSTIQRWITHYRTLLESIIESPQRRLAELQILSESELNQVLLEWNPAATQYAGECAHKWFESQAKLTPQALALFFDDEQLTYAELNRRSNLVAHHLRSLGVGREDLAGLLVERSIAMIVGLLGILKAGAAYLPLDPEYPKDRLKRILEDSRARVLITHERLIERIPEQIARVVYLDRDWLSISKQSEHNPEVAVEPENLAYVIYTSGSTGKPKGVMVQHSSLTSYIKAANHHYHVKPGDRVLQFASISFDWSADEIYTALLNGATLVLRTEAMLSSVFAFLQKCAEWNLTVIMPTTAYWHEITNACGAKLFEFPSSVRLICIGGERVQPERVAEWRKRMGKRAQVINTYGPTETTVVATMCDLSELTEDASSLREMPIGKAVENARAYILDNHLNPVSIGVTGELLIGGAGVARGYFEAPEAAAEKFIPDPFCRRAGERLYKTGDLVRYLLNGNIEFIGRRDEQVKVRGYRVELAEVEWALNQHPDVKEGAVLAQANDKGDKRLIGYAVLAEDRETTSAELRAYMRQKLPEYMVPAVLIKLDKMPLTPNGKVDRQALPAPDGERPSSETAYVAPRTALERYLTKTWQDILGIEKIGIHDNFFELGGDSIKAVLSTNKLQEELEEVVHIVALFDAPTIEELARYLGKHYSEAVRRVFGSESLDGIETGKQEIQAIQTKKIDATMLEEVRRLIVTPASRRRSAKRTSRKNPQAIFILSPPRSGSTLLRVMLAGHSQLFAPPELELLAFDTLLDRSREFEGAFKSWTEGTVRALMQIRGVNAEEAKREMERYEQEQMSVKEFYRVMQEAIGSKRLVDKTPSYAQDIEVLRRAEEYFEDALYIHLLRHPRAMIRSFEEARFAQGFDHFFSQRQIAELMWLISQQNIVEFLKQVPEERQHRVRFEELVKQPKEVFDRVCEFLGIGFEPEMIQPYQNKKEKMTDGIHAESEMIGDHKFQEHGKIDARVADRWAEQSDEDFLGEMTWAMAEELGYPRAAAPAAIKGNGVPATRKDLTPIQPVARDNVDSFPLSSSQQRLWFIDQWMPGNTVYHISDALRISGTLNLKALEQSITEVIRRHEVLRTTFSAIDGRPQQVISPARPFRLPIIDLTQTPEGALQPRASQLAMEEVIQPFNLAQGPLLRVILLNLGDDDQAVILTTHHIICDGWSMNLFVQEIRALYGAFSTGAPSPLPELPIQYADYAIWQREWLKGDALEGELSYWKHQLAGAPDVLALPTDFPRPPAQTFRGARAPLALPMDLTESVKSVSQQSKATLFMMLLGAFQLLLYWFTGKDDVVVGSPISGRNRSETEKLIGFFVNTLVLRVRLSGNPTFRELLGRVREAALGAFAHQNLPFDKLVEELQPQRDLSYNPVCQVTFVLQNTGSHQGRNDLLELPGLTINSLDAKSETSQFDLSLNVRETDYGLEGSMEYNTDLFEQTTITRLIKLYEALLRYVADRPDARLDTIIEMLSGADRKQQSISEKELEEIRVKKFKKGQRKAISRSN